MDFEPTAPRVAARRGNMSWSLKVVAEPDGTYSYHGNGTVDYLDAQGNVIPGLALSGDLMNILTAQERQQLRAMLDRVAAFADQRRGL